MSHGKPSTSPVRRNANRRSPVSPCHPKAADSTAVPAMDLTGYRAISRTRPILVMDMVVSSLAQDQ